MTAVFSICLLPKPDRGVNLRCFAHAERLQGEPLLDGMRSRSYVHEIISQLCDPRPDDDPDAVRMLARGTPPKDALELFTIYIVPCRTRHGMCFVSDYVRRPNCHPTVSSVSMELYADFRRWIKHAHSHFRPFCRLPKGAQHQLVSRFHDKIFQKGVPVYDILPQDEIEAATGGIPPAPDSDAMLSDLLGLRQDR